MYILEKEFEAKKYWKWIVKYQGIPDDVPANPDEVYVDEWKGWTHYVGWVGFEMN